MFDYDIAGKRIELELQFMPVAPEYLERLLSETIFQSKFVDE